MSMRVGYCTNVHPATTVTELLQQWQRHAVAVRKNWHCDYPLGIGVWLPAQIVRELLADAEKKNTVRRFLDTHQLLPFTFNGFPYGDFHRPVVKHDVYFPTWWQPERTEYTLRLIEILHEWLPPGERGSISTLPVSWGCPPPTIAELDEAARQLHRVARALAELEAQTGREIVLALEPEPGCALQYSRDVVTFFERYLWPLDEPLMRRYLTVCHDICHAAVMFELQEQVLQAYQDAGIRVGKVQVSSAVRMVPQETPELDAAAYRQLAEFNEPKYLHQTSIRSRQGELRFFEDLTLALGYYKAPLGDAEWRVHFHVPIYLEALGALATSVEDIRRCLAALHRWRQTDHFEVETYAWNVLPPQFEIPSLAEGITRELAFLLAEWQAVTSTALGTR